MTDIKTRLNDTSVSEFIATVDDDNKRRDSQDIIGLMQEATGAEPKMWGASIVGFGSYHYKYASDRKGDWMHVRYETRP